MGKQTQLQEPPVTCPQNFLNVISQVKLSWWQKDNTEPEQGVSLPPALQSMSGSYTAQMWWWLWERVKSHLLISVPKMPRREWEKIWRFSLLQNWDEEPAFCWVSELSEPFANHKLTHPKYTLGKKKKQTQTTNIKTPPFHLPFNKSCHSKCRIKTVNSKMLHLKAQKSCTNKKTEGSHIEW